MTLSLPPANPRNSYAAANMTVGTPTKAWAMCSVELNSVNPTIVPEWVFRFGANNSGCTFGFQAISGILYFSVNWRTSAGSNARRNFTITANTPITCFCTFDSDVNGGNSGVGRLRWWFNGVEQTEWDISGQTWHGNPIAPTIGGDDEVSAAKTYKVLAAAGATGGILSPSEITAYTVGSSMSGFSTPPTWQANVDGINGAPIERVLDVISSNHAVQNGGDKYPLNANYGRFLSATQPELPYGPLASRTGREMVMTITPPVATGALKIAIGLATANVTPPSNSQVVAGDNQNGTDATYFTSIPVSSTDPIPVTFINLAPDVSYRFTIVHDQNGSGDYSNNQVTGIVNTARLMAIQQLQSSAGVPLAVSPVDCTVFNNFKASGGWLVNVPAAVVSAGTMSLNLSTALAGVTALDIGDVVDCGIEYMDGGARRTVITQTPLSDPLVA